VLLSLGSVEPSDFLTIGPLVLLEFPKWLSLGLIVVIFTEALLYARRVEQRALSRAARQASGLTRDEDA